jgi:predicted transcriptional regulator
MLAKRRKIARNTVQTTVARLHARGMLRARPAGNAFVYTASQPRQRLLGRFVTRNAFGGSKRALMLALLEDEKLSPKEAAEIRELIDRAQAKRKGKTK